MGNSANKPLLQGMTEVSSGFAVNISNSDDIVGRIMEATSKLSHAAMHDVEVKISGIKVSEQSPSRIGSVYRGEQLIIFGHYWGGSDDKENQVSIALTAKVGGKKVAYDTSFVLDSNRTQSNENPELERLWAFSKIEELENSMHYFGENSDTEQAITDIALEFGLVTDYTSMLILEEQQYESYGIERRNQQRVETEHRARESRKQSGVQNNRVDTKKPMHSKPASNHRNGGGSGGGSIHIYGLLLLMVLVGFRRYEKGRL
jgi:Ca-activated chloride channel family protein